MRAEYIEKSLQKVVGEAEIAGRRKVVVAVEGLGVELQGRGSVVWWATAMVTVTATTMVMITVTGCSYGCGYGCGHN